MEYDINKGYIPDATDISKAEERERRQAESERRFISSPDPNHIADGFIPLNQKEQEPWEPPEKDEPTPEPEPQQSAGEAVEQEAWAARPSNRTSQGEVPLLARNIQYLNIRAKHHREVEFSWPEVAILSEIDFWMEKSKQPCHSSIVQLTAVGRLKTRQSCKNTLRKLTKAGVIIALGYHGTARERIVSPAYSDYPLTSKGILANYGNK
jgi:hypothetical protein